ncbi:hypothetical protein [Rhizobium sp. BT-226]|uniref:hypothetical protein n=1 Tax=Rhizobium sp. BT-226 TaxID=2986922 RepID=UPI0021F7DA97|nr:hypothetical protein [Rhizobium sp. BT-226]MCW0016010.1 hypothetical protein [Rhizobium sp. BT-226]
MAAEIPAPSISSGSMSDVWLLEDLSDGHVRAWLRRRRSPSRAGKELASATSNSLINGQRDRLDGW